MDDLQEVLEDIIALGSYAYADRTLDADALRGFIVRITTKARHALDLTIDEALCHPSPRDEETAPVLYEES
jgi:hypothetical protein